MTWLDSIIFTGVGGGLIAAVVSLVVTDIKAGEGLIILKTLGGLMLLAVGARIFYLGIEGFRGMAL